MDTLLQILVFGFFVEAIVETLKLAWEPKTRSTDRFVALGVGIAGALLFRIDAFAWAGIPVHLPPIGAYIAQVFTGVILSRGGNFLHDFLQRVRGVRVGS